MFRVAVRLSRKCGGGQMANPRSYSTIAKFIQDRRLPVIQAPMAGVTKSDMVIASCKAGLIGSLGAASLQPEEIAESIKQIKAETDNAPFNVNLFIIDNHEGYSYSDAQVEWLKKYYDSENVKFNDPSQYAPRFEEQFRVLLEEAPPIVSFTFGILNKKQVDMLHEKGIKVIGTATTTPEAIEWENVGADAIAAQGIEAGGHRGSFMDPDYPGMGLFALIPEIVNSVNIPVIACGGIMSGKGVVAAMTLGASAVQMGTRFLTCTDTKLPKAYFNGLQSKLGHETELTKAFSGRNARGVVNKFMQHGKDKQPLPYPVQNALTGALRKDAIAKENSENYSLWTGQGVAQITNGSTIQQVVDQLHKEIQVARQSTA